MPYLQSFSFKLVGDKELEKLNGLERNKEKLASEISQWTSSTDGYSPTRDASSNQSLTLAIGSRDYQATGFARFVRSRCRSTAR